MELGWRGELDDRNDPDGVFKGWLNRWVALGVPGVLGVHGCAGVWFCRTVLGGV